jgi:hypothetical protein
MLVTTPRYKVRDNKLNLKNKNHRKNETKCNKAYCQLCPFTLTWSCDADASRDSAQSVSNWRENVIANKINAKTKQNRQK